MPRNGGYEPIPDVTGTVATDGDTPSSSAHGGGKVDDAAAAAAAAAQERYPEANESEAELLGLLDEFVADSTVIVKLPTVSIYDFDKGNMSSCSACAEFCRAVLWPTVCALLMAGVGVWMVGSDYVSSSTAGSYITKSFPYVTAVLVLLGTLPPMHRRISAAASLVTSKVGPTHSAATRAVRDVATSVSQKIALVRMKLEEIVDFMRPKLKRASKREKRLLKMDPQLVIPDPDDILKELDVAKGDVESVLALEKDAVGEVTEGVLGNASKGRLWIPSHLQSAERYRSYLFGRALVLCLVTQLVAVQLMVMYYPMDGTAADTSSSRRSNRFTMGVTAAGVGGYAQNALDSVHTAWPNPLVLVVEVLLMAILQLMILFWTTNASHTVATVNQMRQTVSDETNLLLRKRGVVFLCQDILDRRLRLVRAQLLERIRFIYKLGMLMEIVEEEQPGDSSPPKSSPPSSPRRRSPPTNAATTTTSTTGGSTAPGSARKLLKNLWSSSDDVGARTAGAGGNGDNSNSNNKPSPPKAQAQGGTGTSHSKSSPTRSVFKTLRAVPDS